MRPWDRPREHGVASYRKGCRCPSCEAAERARQARWRERLRERAGRPLVRCEVCDGLFHPSGLLAHETLKHTRSKG